MKKDEIDEIKFIAAVVLSLLMTISFVVWAFIAAKDGVDAFYAVVSLFVSPLMWLILFGIFGQLLFMKNDK